MKNESDNDKEADLFARCLLMPEEFIRQEINNIPKRLSNFDLCDDRVPAIEHLATKFQVSRAMMLLRLQELGMLPCAGSPYSP